MTTPGEMVKRAAAVLGQPEVSLSVIDRELAAQGLRTKGGRGRSAAKMTSGDVCNLLIAAASGGLVKDAADTVRSYSCLPCTEVRKWSLQGFPLPTVQALPEDHTFGQALQAFLDAAVANEFVNASEVAPKFESGGYSIPNIKSLEFRLIGPLPQAAIRILVGGVFSEEHHYSPFPREVGDLSEWSRVLNEHGSGDLARMHWFTMHTLREMASFLRGENTS